MSTQPQAKNNIYTVIITANKMINTHLGNEWTFEFHRAKTIAGSCFHKKKTISLSQIYAEYGNMDDIKNTILHEIAHALTPGDGHGYRWQAMCVKIGARPERCNKNFKLSDLGQEIAKPKYIGVCPVCNAQHMAFRKSKHLLNQACTKNNCSAHRLRKAIQWSVNI